MVKASSKNGNGNAAFFFSFLLALQFGLQPILANWYTPPTINKSLIVMATEASKILIAFISILLFHSRDELIVILKGWNLSESLKVAALPAILYAVQNVLIQHGYVYLNSLTFNLLNQTKTLSAALWLFILMGQRQSYMQLFALFLMSAAAVILNMNPDETPKAVENIDGIQSHMGIVCVLIASMLSGVSAALTQKVLAGSGKQRNSFLLSAELALYGIVFLLLKEIFQSFTTQQSLFISNVALFDKWNLTTWIPILTNASGGLVVGLVTKHAGGVVKGFALVAGLVLTGVVQWVVAGIPLGIYDWSIAAILVSISIVLHTQFPPKPVGSQPKGKAD